MRSRFLAMALFLSFIPAAHGKIIKVWGDTFEFADVTLVVGDVFDTDSRTYIHKGELKVGDQVVAGTEKTHHVEGNLERFSIESTIDYKVGGKKIHSVTINVDVRAEKNNNEWRVERVASEMEAAHLGPPKLDKWGRPKENWLSKTKNFQNDKFIDQDKLKPFLNDIDAAIEWGNYAYFFKGNQYIKVRNQDDLKDSTVKLSYPKTITDDRWPGWQAADFASGIDAAVEWGEDAYFFKGKKCIKVKRERHPDNTIYANYPKDISDEFPGLNNNTFKNGVDAAVGWKEGDDGYAFFFKGNKYTRINMSNRKEHKPDYPLEIKENWEGWNKVFESGINSAVSWSGDKAFFIRDNDFIGVNRDDHPKNTVMKKLSSLSDLIHDR